MNAETLRKLKSTNSATLSTILFRKGLRNTAIRGALPLIAPSERMVGPAVTVRYIPSREDIDGTEYSSSPDNHQRNAIDSFPADHVLVLDCRGIAEVAGLGAMLARRLVANRAAGVVLDGGVRDSHDIASLGLPTFCKGPAAPANLVAHHASDMNQPIACGGVAVYPGDIIFGDEEAVIVIPSDWADEVADLAVEKDSVEEFIALEIEGGKSTLGIYPPNAATMERYREWRAKQT